MNTMTGFWQEAMSALAMTASTSGRLGIFDPGGANNRRAAAERRKQPAEDMARKLSLDEAARESFVEILRNESEDRENMTARLRDRLNAFAVASVTDTSARLDEILALKSALDARREKTRRAIRSLLGDDMLAKYLRLENGMAGQEDGSPGDGGPPQRW